MKKKKNYITIRFSANAASLYFLSTFINNNTIFLNENDETELILIFKKDLLFCRS